MAHKMCHVSPIDRYILPNRILCSMVALWPMDEHGSAMRNALTYFRLAFSFTAVGSVFVPEILMIAANWGDLSVLTGVGCVTTTVGQCLFKMSYVLARRRRLIGLYRDVRHVWGMSDEPDDRAGFEELARYAKIVTIGFYLSCMCNVVTFTVAAMIIAIRQSHADGNRTDATRSLPFEVWYGPEALQSPNFEVAFACQFVASLMCCAGICGLDASFMTLILHVCGQFKLIQAWIGNVGAAIDESGASGKYHLPNIRYGIRKCVHHHQHILKMVDEVNALIGPILFVQILTSGLEICLSGYALQTVTAGADVLKFTSYLVSMLVQLVVWCWPAEILIQESKEVANAAFYEMPWYRLPAPCQRDLCVLIVRSQKYSRVTAYTLQTISISTLTNVFNTAASYFTLLRQVQ